MGITTQWNEHEDAALDGLPHRAQVLYLRCLRRYMDYSTGVVGRVREISLDMFKDVLEVRGLYSSKHRDVKPSVKEVRVSLGQLERVGLIERRRGRQVNRLMETYVFFLPLASLDNSVLNSLGKARAQDSGHVANHRKLPANQEKINIPDGARAKPGHESLGTHQVSGKSTTTTHAREPRFFAMREGWEPDSESLKAHARMQGVLLDQLCPEDYVVVLGEFKSYWMGDGRERNQGSWEGALVKSIKFVLVKTKEAGHGGQTGAGRGGRNKGANNLMRFIREGVKQ